MWNKFDFISHITRVNRHPLYWKHPFILLSGCLSGGGAESFCTFSNIHFSIKKGVCRSQISWLFLIHYELLENKKKNFGFSQCRWSRRCGLIQPPPRSQATSRRPALLGLKPISKKNCIDIFCPITMWKNLAKRASKYVFTGVHFKSLPLIDVNSRGPLS